MLVRMASRSTPRIRKDGKFDERSALGKELNRRSAAVDGHLRTLTGAEMTALEHARATPLLDIGLITRSNHGDPDALSALAALSMHSPHGSLSLALDLYERACVTGCPDILCLPHSEPQWTFLMAAANAGRPAAMYAVALGTQHPRTFRITESSDTPTFARAMMERAAAAGLPAARIRMRWDDHDAIGRELMIQAVCGNLHALARLADPRPQRMPVGGGPRDESPLPPPPVGPNAATAYTFGLLRFAWLCMVVDPKGIVRDPLRITMSREQAGALGSSDYTRRAMGERWDHVNQQRLALPPAKREECERRALGILTIARFGLRPVPRGVVLASWFTAGLYGLLWFAKFLIGASAAAEVALPATKVGPVPRPWKRKSITVAIGLFGFAMYASLAWLAQSDPASGRESLTAEERLAFTIGGVTIGLGVGLALLHYAIRMRDWLAREAGIPSGKPSPAVSMVLWACGFGTWWTLIVGGPILSLHGALFVAPSRRAIDALREKRPNWFAWQIDKLSLMQRFSLALRIGDRTARREL